MLILFVRLRLIAERVAQRAMGAPEMRTPGGHDTTSSFMGYTILRSTQFDYLVVLSVMIIQIEKTRQASWLANLSGLVVDSLVVSHWLTCAAKDSYWHWNPFPRCPVRERIQEEIAIVPWTSLERGYFTLIGFAHYQLQVHSTWRTVNSLRALARANQAGWGLRLLLCTCDLGIMGS